MGSLTTEGDGVTSAAKLNSQLYFYSSSPTSLNCTVEVTAKVFAAAGGSSSRIQECVCGGGAVLVQSAPHGAGRGDEERAG